MREGGKEGKGVRKGMRGRMGKREEGERGEGEG